MGMIMTTIFLRFSDRAEAIMVLSAVLGFDGEQTEDGRQMWSSGLHEGERYHLSFLSDMGVICGAAGDHVNLLWPGPAETAPDFGAYVVAPATPSCVFSA